MCENAHRMLWKGVILVRRRLIWAAAMLACSVALGLGFRLSGEFARHMADTMSRPAAAALARMSGRVAVPLAELLLIAGVALFCAALIWALVRRRLDVFCERAALAVSALLLSYTLLWSAQLYAPLLTARATSTYTAAELSDYCRELIQSANALALAEPDMDIPPDNVKFARYPELMRSLGMGGVYVPWTGETIISELEPNLSLPFIAAHESAHAQGYAREDEANYIAYQTCRAGGARSRYAGEMYALYYCMEALHDRDESLWNAAREDMNQTVRRDYYRLNGLRTVPDTPALPWRDAAMAAFGGGGQGKTYGDVVHFLMADRLSAP